jgi:hypothetical protein
MKGLPRGNKMRGTIFLLFSSPTLLSRRSCKLSAQSWPVLNGLFSLPPRLQGPWKEPTRRPLSHAKRGGFLVLDRDKGGAAGSLPSVPPLQGSLETLSDPGESTWRRQILRARGPRFLLIEFSRPLQLLPASWPVFFLSSEPCPGRDQG